MLPSTKVSVNCSGESKTTAQWHLLGCSMQLICGDGNEYKSIYVTLNHNVNERENRFSLPANYELSRRENNPKSQSFQ